ncbi:MAG: hypothetical protein LBV19_06045 [Streptococcaceae bacterium]|jgi:ABC-type multidrug transport system permease subunit|nr:hypothetical protein [Streptococcaceae bacterium]
MLLIFLIIWGVGALIGLALGLVFLVVSGIAYFSVSSNSAISLKQRIFGTKKQWIFLLYFYLFLAGVVLLVAFLTGQLH